MHLRSAVRDYNWFRYYDPRTGRYITSDPVGIDGGLNTYLYANANPLRYTDQTGLNPLAVCAINPPACAAIIAEAGKIIAAGLIAAGILSIPGDTPKRCEDANDRTVECNAAFSRCYNQNPNNPEWTNRCAKALEQCLNTDLPVIFPNGDIVQ